jgi:hypothetical protein
MLPSPLHVFLPFRDMGIDGIVRVPVGDLLIDHAGERSSPGTPTAPAMTHRSRPYRIATAELALRLAAVLE